MGSGLSRENPNLSKASRAGPMAVARFTLDSRHIYCNAAGLRLSQVPRSGSGSRPQDTARHSSNTAGMYLRWEPK